MSDVYGAASIETLANELPDSAKRHRNWKIFPCSEVTGDGLMLAMDWMVDACPKQHNNLD